MFYPVFNLAHTCQNIQYVEFGQYTEEEEEEEEEEGNSRSVSCALN
jgi:hypothetical protein